MNRSSLQPQMNSFQLNSTIHLEPGIFETRGYGATVEGGQPKSRQRITSAGMDVTVLKLVEATDQATDLEMAFLLGT